MPIYKFFKIFVIGFFLVGITIGIFLRIDYQIRGDKVLKEKLEICEEVEVEKYSRCQELVTEKINNWKMSSEKLMLVSVIFLLLFLGADKLYLYRKIKSNI